jgi:septum formation protein
VSTSRPKTRLVLASGSPRRRDLLAELGVEVEIRPVNVDERVMPGEEPEGYVRRVALAKAQARARPGELVIAADTVVLLDGDILGKPNDAADARFMLARLSGREHVVLTGVAVADPATSRVLWELVRSRVVLAGLSAEEIDWYVATGEPLDKAGSYAIQGLGALFVAAVDGNYSNVVGLPLPTLYSLCARLGYDLRSFRRVKTA